jgi:mono/diheme cytochrome c family protein
MPRIVSDHLIRRKRLLAIFVMLTLGGMPFSVGLSRVEAETDHSAAQTGKPVAGENEKESAFGDRQEGFRVLTEEAFLPSDFNQRVIDNIWQSWPEPLRSRAEMASVGQRRAMAFQRYGLTPRPNHVANSKSPADSVDPGKPLQYVVGQDGEWTMNCFSCHGGSVYGIPTPGAPNNRFALQTMTEEVRSTKFRIGEPLTRMDFGSLVIPLGTTHGTTNAVVFGMGLMHYRDKDLNVLDKPPAAFTHHDMDAPPWWHFYKRPYLYIDGFAQKGHRGLMQFTLVPENGPEFYAANEDNFRDVYAYLSSLRAPKYPLPIDQTLAAQGRHLFEQNCSHCHGTYGHSNEADAIAAYPNQMVPIDEIGTDPVRHQALPVEGRKKYAESWFANAGQPDQQTTLIDPAGYVAPPLDGVWASAPYFHNGSVPTLWHVLRPKQRPVVWRRTEAKMDRKKIGLTIEVTDRVPLEHPDVAHRRSFFDTRRFGKSSAGHDFPSDLSETECLAVLEYLKTL